MDGSRRVTLFDALAQSMYFAFFRLPSVGGCYTEQGLINSLSFENQNAVIFASITF